MTECTFKTLFSKFIHFTQEDQCKKNLTHIIT